MIDTDVGGVRVLRRHLPEWAFDDGRGIIANAQFQKENFLPLPGTQKVFIPLRCPMPAPVFHKFIIAAEVHGQWFPTVGADRKKFGRDFHILLPFDHFEDHDFVIKGLLTARLAALEQAIIALRVEQPLFIKAYFLKAVVNVCGDDKIVLVPHQLQKVIVDQFGGIHIAVDVDVSAPIRPMLFRRGKRIKATGVHIVEAVFFLEVRKVFLKAFAAVGEACGGRQPCPRADDHGITVP